MKQPAKELLAQVLFQRYILILHVTPYGMRRVSSQFLSITLLALRDV